jgi:hypothetical protein
LLHDVRVCLNDGVVDLPNTCLPIDSNSRDVSLCK